MAHIGTTNRPTCDMSRMSFALNGPQAVYIRLKTRVAI